VGAGEIDVIAGSFNLVSVVQQVVKFYDTWFAGLRPPVVVV